MAAIRAGRVSVNGIVIAEPEYPTTAWDRLALDGHCIAAVAPVYVALNKPRGLVTTLRDEHGRGTVYSCFAGAALPHLAPVGRLDKASEGLLLFSNDTAWAAGITDPARHVAKTYHVQIDRPPDTALVAALVAGRVVAGERLAVRAARSLRSGVRRGWLEIELDEGRNRHIRRLLEALDVTVLRLLRIAIGPISLGSLARGAWRNLSNEEVSQLGAHGREPKRI